MTYRRFDRRELKFLVCAKEAQAIRTVLRQRMEIDPHGDAGGRYPIISMYYDNDDRDIYLETLRGVGSRRKLRLRVYGREDGQVPPASFLEIKHRYGSRSVKRRVSLRIDEALRVGQGEWPIRSLDPLEEHFVHEMQQMVLVRKLHPVSVLRYDRQAFRGVGPESDLRVTFDQNIQYRARDFRPRPDDQDFNRMILDRDHMIMEIKVDNRVPYWLAELAASAGARRQSFSKFRRSIEDIIRRSSPDDTQLSTPSPAAMQSDKDATSLAPPALDWVAPPAVNPQKLNT